jgi:hypothetical protein
MQKVEGSSPFSRSQKKPRLDGVSSPPSPLPIGARGCSPASLRDHYEKPADRSPRYLQRAPSGRPNVRPRRRPLHPRPLRRMSRRNHKAASCVPRCSRLVVVRGTSVATNKTAECDAPLAVAAMQDNGQRLPGRRPMRPRPSIHDYRPAAGDSESPTGVPAPDRGDVFSECSVFILEPCPALISPS